MPDWLYLNVIDINNGNGPILRDLAGTQLSIINNGVFNVSKTDSYASSYPKTIVDKSSNIRNWVWQIALDKDENPVIAYPHIDNDKTSHVYWYARWNGSEWRRTWVQYAGHAFHQNWNKTERCYSGGMTLDPDNINDMYLSIPTKDGQYNKDGVYEIWRYTIDDEGNVAGSEQITKNSPKNNVRPFILPGSKNSKLRLSWMQGDYYYWMVNKNYPQGYPTSVLCNYEWTEEVRDIQSAAMDCICLSTNKTLHSIFTMNEAKYEGTLLSASEANTFTYGLGSDNYPFITINGKTYEVPKLDFDTVCQLEENGISLLAMNEANPKIATMLRAFVAWIIGSTPRQASMEIQEHLENGGNIADLLNAITTALNDSGFSNGNRRNQNVREFPDHKRKNNNRNRRRSESENTEASQKS